MPRRLLAVVAALGVVCPLGCSDDAAAPSSSDPRVDIVLDPEGSSVGGEVIHEAYLTVQRVEIVPCTDGGTAWHRMARWFLPEAHAHGGTTPTSLSAPTLDPLGGHDAPIAVGTLAPPTATSFCAVRVTLGPADRDAAGMPASVSVLGRTLWIRATRGASDLTLTSSESRTTTLPVAAFAVGRNEHRSILHLARNARGVLDDVAGHPDLISTESAHVLDQLVASMAARIEE